MNIHPAAIVHPDAQIGEGVTIGPFSIVEAGAVIGNDCTIGSHSMVLGSVTLGSGTTVGHGSILGANPQSIGFDPAISSRVEIGPNNIIREHVTIHRSTIRDGVTRVGEGNYLMTGVHLGHDVTIGDNNILANNCLLGGHVVLGNRSFLGGGSVFHQFVRLGDFVMIRGIVGIGKDVPHYVACGAVNRVAGLNIVGLRRGGFSPTVRTEIKKAFNLVYREGLNLSQALSKAAESTWIPEAQTFFDFLSVKSSRGYCLTLMRTLEDAD
ncbi:MAG: acyl-ACP--UDP-N-acetylglucosamine O-acyltransferase [Verrucomicrobiales bacterium]|nr:acyl-ACP--UDP-N-acetylglucosamine O-acyltransferase [Verrucomicrobiae bacterium]MCP5553516.1 acyl-ACP--UDP-N-acetylglucosamine O-acyltransferase [Akkermansiaceae bacterium]HRX55687.1 acyl-ACP--UDP-N-acetylglucosamine O-acyltransferase [Verrucomicrobiales bacterium]